MDIPGPRAKIARRELHVFGTMYARDLSDNQREALGADIRRQGGEVVGLSLAKSAINAERTREELEKLEEADVFVTRYRTGPAYAKVR